MRRFDDLPTLRGRTPLFFLTWTVIHRIDETSPLFGKTREELLADRSEILVIIKGLDETFVSTIHARASYQPDEIVWGGKLADIFSYGADGRFAIDFRRFHEVVDA
jgi:inward rectifier potassium channel